MANYTISCPHCGGTLEVQDEWAGMETTCPLCNNAFTIPRQNPAAETMRRATPPLPPPNTPPGFEPLSGHVRNEEVDDLPIPDPGMTPLPPIARISKFGYYFLAGLTLLLGVLTIVASQKKEDGGLSTGARVLIVLSILMVLLWVVLGFMALIARSQSLPQRQLFKKSVFDANKKANEKFLSSICDEVLRMDGEYLEKLSVLRRFGKDKSQLVSSPATLFAPAFDGVPHLAEFEVLICEDDMTYRYNLEAVTKIYTFEDQLFIYKGIWDYTLGRMLSETTEAFFFKDITDVTTQSNYKIATKDEPKGCLSIIIPWLGREKRTVYKESESFTLTSSSGNSISLTLGFDEAIAASGATYTRRSDNEKIVHAIRKMVEEKKAAIHE